MKAYNVEKLRAVIQEADLKGLELAKGELSKWGTKLFLNWTSEVLTKIVEDEMKLGCAVLNPPTKKKGESPWHGVSAPWREEG